MVEACAMFVYVSVRHYMYCIYRVVFKTKFPLGDNKVNLEIMKWLQVNYRVWVLNKKHWSFVWLEGD